MKPTQAFSYIRTLGVQAHPVAAEAGKEPKEGFCFNSTFLLCCWRFICCVLMAKNALKVH